MDKFVIFDIDGTLNQTELYAVEAYQKAAEKRGKKISREEFLPCIGLSLMTIAEKLFGHMGQKELEAWRKDIQDLEFELMEKNAKPFEGTEDVLKTLQSEGYRLAICSNAFMIHIEHVLKAIGLRDYFDAVGYLEMGSHKPEVLHGLLHVLKPSAACMVGDRRFDLEAAQQNQIPLIGCAYGYAPDEIRDAAVVVTKPCQIPEAVRQLM